MGYRVETPKGTGCKHRAGTGRKGIQRTTRVSQIRSVHTGEPAPWPTGSARHNKQKSVEEYTDNEDSLSQE